MTIKIEATPHELEKIKTLAGMVDTALSTDAPSRGLLYEVQKMLAEAEIREAGPLIKDEKIRKAVRAWAEACGAKQIKYSIAPNQYYDADMGTGFSIKFLTKPIEVYLEDGKTYTIAELCGEEEDD